MEIVRTRQEQFRFRLPPTWLLRAQRNWTLMNSYDCNFRLCRLFKLRYSYIYRLIFIACCYHSYGDKDFQCVDGDVKPRLLARILAVFIVAHAQAVHLCCQPRR